MNGLITKKRNPVRSFFLYILFIPCYTNIRKIERSVKMEYQKESISLIYVTGSTVFLVLANKHSFLSTPNRKKIYTFVYACLLVLTKIPQKCRLFSARARIVFRTKHFSSPHYAARMSACRRIRLRISGKFRPKSGIPACFFLLVFLFEVNIVLNKKGEIKKGSSH